MSKTFDWWPAPEKTLVELAEAAKERRAGLGNHVQVLIDAAAQQAAEVYTDVSVALDSAYLSTAVQPNPSGFKPKTFEEIKEAMEQAVMKLKPWENIGKLKLTDHIAEWSEFEANFGDSFDLVGKPEGSKSEIKPGEYSFTPDVSGTYRIKLGDTE